jgi:hypothetical protein
VDQLQSRTVSCGSFEPIRADQNNRGACRSGGVRTIKDGLWRKIATHGVYCDGKHA